MMFQRISNDFSNDFSNNFLNLQINQVKRKINHNSLLQTNQMVKNRNDNHTREIIVKINKQLQPNSMFLVLWRVQAICQTQSANNQAKKSKAFLPSNEMFSGNLMPECMQKQKEKANNIQVIVLLLGNHCNTDCVILGKEHLHKG